MLEKNCTKTHKNVDQVHHMVNRRQHVHHDDAAAHENPWHEEDCETLRAHAWVLSTAEWIERGKQQRAIQTQIDESENECSLNHRRLIGHICRWWSWDFKKIPLNVRLTFAGSEEQQEHQIHHRTRIHVDDAETREKWKCAER